MAEFRGPKNLHVGEDSQYDARTKSYVPIPAWATSVYDDVAREYVITLDAENAEKFRAFSDEHRHGFREVQSVDPAPADPEGDTDPDGD